MSRSHRRLAAASALLAAAVLFTACGSGEGGTSGSASSGMDDMAGMNMGASVSVRLTPDQMRGFGVTFATVEQRPLESEVRAAGFVTFDETRTALITPKFGGFVERLHVDFTGRTVRAGEPLAEIYSPELVAAQEELLLAARLQENLSGSSIPGVPSGSGDLVRAARQRLRNWDVSEAHIDAVLERGEAMRTVTLYAPIGGVVVEMSVLRGQAVTPGQTLYRVVDLSRVWVEAELRETEAGLVREGDRATVEITGVAGPPIAATVEYVHPTLQEQSRTLRARMAVANPGGVLKPGMYATVRLAARHRSALTVATSAVLRTGERNVVFVDLGGGRLMPVEVETGLVAGELTEVFRGLEPGQRVVTSAQYLLDSESNLAEVMRAMMAQMNMSDMGSMDMGGMEGMDMGAPDGMQR
jgi:multidrug efflux pump subunit AcrA (membrane-fusion protein)